MRQHSLFGPEDLPVITLVVIHGTFDSKDGPEPDLRWVNADSELFKFLEAHARIEGYRLETIPLEWSGENSEHARRAAAQKLRRLLVKLGKQGRYVHLLCHSHGGSIAELALEAMDWDAIRNPLNIASVCSLGAAYFERKPSWFAVWEKRVRRLMIHLGWVLSLAVLGLLVLSVLPVQTLKTALIAISATIAISVPFAVPYIKWLLSQVTHDYRPDAQAARMARRRYLAIYHAHDEAIAYLRLIEKLRVDPFSPEAWAEKRARLAKRVRRGLVTLAGVSTVLATLGLVGGAVSSFIGTQDRNAFREDLLLAGGLLFGMVVAIWICRRIIFPVLGVILGPFFDGLISSWARKLLSRQAVGAARKAVQGADTDDILTNVQPAPHKFPAHALELCGRIGRRLSMRAAEGVVTFRAQILVLATDGSQACISIDTLRKAIPKDALIHSAYLDDPNVSRMVALHLNRNAIPVAYDRKKETFSQRIIAWLNRRAYARYCTHVAGSE